MWQLQRVIRLVAEEWGGLFVICKDELLKLLTVNPPITDSVQTPISLIAVMLWTKNIIQFFHCHLRLHSQHFQYHLAPYLGVGMYMISVAPSICKRIISFNWFSFRYLKQYYLFNLSEDYTFQIFFSSTTMITNQQ